MTPGLRDHLGDAEDFAEALGALPAPLAEVRAWLLGGFGLHLEAADHWQLWSALWRSKGDDRAPEIVSELIVKKGGERVLQLIKDEAADRDIYIRTDDPELVHLLFEAEGYTTYLGEYDVDYWQRSRPPDSGARLAPDDDDEEVSLDEELDDEPEDEADGDFEDLGVRDLIRALALRPENRKSADPRSGMAFEQVQVPASQFLTVDPTWTEAQLEAFVVAHWENIDWGFASPLYLVGSQVQLDSDTRDRVDILAKGGSGQLVAIELKIGEAKPKDVSQLQAYMTHLDRRGPGKTFGLLVAASFPPRVLNAADQHQRLRLLRFRVPPV